MWNRDICKLNRDFFPNVYKKQINVKLYNYNENKQTSHTWKGVVSNQKYRLTFNY